MNYVVKIIAYLTGATVKEIPCDSLLCAEKIKRGIEINLNHEFYLVDIVEEQP